MNPSIYLLTGSAGFGIFIFLFLWFTKFRKKYTRLIKAPNPLPKQPKWQTSWYRMYEPGRVVWKMGAPEVQPVGNVKCVAYSLYALLAAAPLELKFPPSVSQLFDEYTRRDDQKNNERGGNPIGAMKYLEQTGLIGKTNFIARFLRRFGFCHAFFNLVSIEQIKIFVTQYAPVLTGIYVTANPQIDENGVLYAMTGDFAFAHSVLIYGVDENYPCPDGSRGAFYVRWHLDWFGTDGIIPFSVAGTLINPEWTYGFKL